MKLDAKTMRVIGQDLEKIKMTDFDLELRGEGCVVKGMGILPEPEQPTESQQEPRGLNAGWKQLRETEVEAQPPPEPVEIERSYQPSDIERMEIEAQSLQQNDDGMPGLYSTPEILRVLANYLDSKDSELLRLSKAGRRLSFDYADSTGTRQSDERLYSDLYNFAFQLRRESGD